MSEIMVNRFDQLYVERNGRLTETPHRFTGEPQLRRVIERIVARVGRRIDESSPLVDARLKDGPVSTPSFLPSPSTARRSRSGSSRVLRTRARTSSGSVR